MSATSAKKWRVLMLATLLLLLVVLWLARETGEPLYQGQPAREYVVGNLTTNVGFAARVSAMDPDLAIAGLIEVLKRRQGWRARSYKKAFAMAPQSLQRRLPPPRDYDRAAFVAVHLLGIYGSKAKSAIPVLIGELGRTNRFSLASPIRALAEIDPDDPRVIQALMHFLQSQSSDG